MIEIRLEQDDFEQDVRPMVRAFFPREEIRVAFMPYAEPGDGMPMPHTEPGDGVPMPYAGPDSYILAVHHDDREIRMWFSDPDGRLLREDQVFGQPEPDRRMYKNHLKKVLYRLLSEDTGRGLPWGTLTGIRPTKLVCEMLTGGSTPEEAARFMREQYWCSGPKTELSLRIAKKELELLERMDYQNGYSIYIGIPFCPTTCLYCSFASYPVASYGKYVDAYLDALSREIDFVAGRLPDKRLTTLYVGGGTPTALDERQLERLMIHIRKRLPVEQALEFTVEAGRPDSITREKLQILKRYGVTRISINPQTMVERTLSLIGRRHTVVQIEDAFRMAREEGHTNINMDLIIGLPGETADDVAYTLGRIGPLAPDSLTVHALAIKRAARLKLHLDELKELLPTDAVRMQELTAAYAADHGYEPYYLYRQKNITDNLENTGYARPGMEGLYNILIMEEKQTILALGAAGSSKFVFPEENRIERVENVKYVVDYIERIDEMLERKLRFLRSTVSSEA